MPKQKTSRRKIGNLVAARPRASGRFGRRGPNGVDVAIPAQHRTTLTPGSAIAQAINDALDPTQAPGKVRTMSDMTPEEIAKLSPPRRSNR